MKTRFKRSNSNTAVNFHKRWLKIIRTQLGSSCTYLSHISKGNEFFMKVRMKNQSGGTDTITYKLNGAPNTLTSNDYQALLTTLKNRDYEQGSTQTLSSTKE